MKSYSVVIVGGGPAGCAAAIALLKLGIKDVLILESEDYTKFAIGESIPSDVKVLLLQLGIHGEFLKEQHLPCYGTCSYWGDDRKGFNDTVLSPYGHGWHLDRRKFNLFLSRQAQLLGAEIQLKARFIASTLLENNNHRIQYQQTNTMITIEAQFVVDASGSNAVFAKNQGSILEKGESLYCLARRYNIDELEKISSLTRIEAVHNGWWYGAKLPNNELLIAFYTNQDTMKETKLQQISTWNDALNSTQSIKEGVHESCAIDEKIQGFYANSFCLDKIVGPNWLAIGDAASSYDPIISRGIYKSLTDALNAAPLIAKYVQNKATSLEEFEQYVQQNYRHYLAERAHYYSLEQRWKDAPFWKKFHQLKTAVTSSLS